MPLKPEVDDLLAEAGKLAGEDGYVLLGIFVNHAEAEMGLFSNQNFPPGTVLGFIKEASNLMLDKAKSGDLKEVEQQKGLVH